MFTNAERLALISAARKWAASYGLNDPEIGTALEKLEARRERSTLGTEGRTLMPTPTEPQDYVPADHRAEAAADVIEDHYGNLPADVAIREAMADLMVLATRMGFGYDRLVQNARRAARCTLSEGRSEQGQSDR